MKCLSLSLLFGAAALLLSAVMSSLSAQEEAVSDEKTKLPGQAKNWVGGPSADWLIHYDAALAKAAAEHKKVYVLSTGSDWCGWCIKLRNDVLTTPQFRKFAKKNLVLLYLDSPSKKKLPADQQTHNDQVRSMLKFGGGVPSAKILNEKGEVVAERSGYADLKTYMKFLKQAVSTAPARD